MPILIVLIVSMVTGFVFSRALRRRPGTTARPVSTERRQPPLQRTSPPAGRPGIPPSASARPEASTRSGLTPPELQRAIFTEALRGVRVDARDRCRSSSEFVLRVHPDDVETVQRNRRWLLPGVVEALGSLGESTSGGHGAPPTVRLLPDPSRRAGLPELDTVVDEPPEGVAALVRIGTNERHLLTRDRSIIGRGEDATVPAADPRVSRHHARITRHGSSWFVTDLSSSNGTTIDGRPLTADQPVPITPPAILGVGPIEFEFRNESSEGRALTDAERVELGRRAFPPPRSR